MLQTLFRLLSLFKTSQKCYLPKGRIWLAGSPKCTYIKLLMHGGILVADYHNEAAAGKDVCNSHFAHQQARVETCIAEGTWWEKEINSKATS